MMSTLHSDPSASWSRQNQDYLCAEFERIRQRLSSEKGDATKAAELDRIAADLRCQMPEPAAIETLSELFGLTRFERSVLLLCAGVEMDSHLADACAHAQGHPQRTYVSFGLAMSLLDDPHWDAITQSRPLRRLRMIEPHAGSTLTTAPLHLDERILHYLVGENALDLRLQSLLRQTAVPTSIADEHRGIALRAAHVLQSDSSGSPLIQLCGDDPQGQEDIATLAAHELGRELFIANVEDLPAAGPELDQFAILWKRESLMLGGALFIHAPAEGFGRAASRLVERLPGPLFLGTREAVPLQRNVIRFDVNMPGPLEQKRLWLRALGETGQKLNGLLDDLSEQFRLSARTISSTGSVMAAAEQFEPATLWEACRALSRPKLQDLAQRIVPSASWEDLILPEPQTHTLHQLVAQVRHRLKVYETWGFAGRGRRGLGVSALFTGASGTGKTMAAEVLAGELRLDLYRIDLSSVVSKYIGETEKNLKRVFDAAQESGALLLFDEADALFGKRSEVRDSHDRYANIEVGYLLQRMEAYQGLAILTTNLRSALDTSFQRRLRFTINFPFPDAKQRQAIWKSVFPQATPTGVLDHKRLAQMNATGGNIRNIAVNAAFIAAQAGTPVEMANLLEAARLEAQKIERPLTDAETRGWI
jgi:ATPase family associated with various cellular activities (AAA)/Winged helix domain, variant